MMSNGEVPSLCRGKGGSNNGVNDPDKTGKNDDDDDEDACMI